MIPASKLTELTNTTQQSLSSDSEAASGSFAQRDVVDISGLSKPLVLQYLWNNAQGEGPGSAHESFWAVYSMLRSKEMSITAAEHYILGEGRSLKFDYVHAKQLSVDISGNQMNAKRYDDYHGQGTARSAISRARNPISREKFSDEFQRFDQAVSAANHPNMKELTEDQLSKLLAYTLYGEGDGKI